MSYPGKHEQQEQPHHRIHPSDDSFDKWLYQIDVDAIISGSDEDNPPELHDDLMLQQLEAQFKAKSHQQPAAALCEDYSSNYSTTARWRIRVQECQDFARTTKEWCQGDSPAITDLNFPEYSASPSCCSRCKSYHDLNSLCQALISCKSNVVQTTEQHTQAKEQLVRLNEGYAQANEQLVEAIENHTQAEELLVQTKEDYAQSMEKHAEDVENMNENPMDFLISNAADRVDEKSSRVESSAKLVAANAKLVVAMEMLVIKCANEIADKKNLIIARANEIAHKKNLIIARANGITDKKELIIAHKKLVIQCANEITNNAEKLYNCHIAAKSLLASLSVAGNNAHTVTDKSVVKPSTMGLAESRFDTELKQSPTKFDIVRNPVVMSELDNVDFLCELDTKHMDLVRPFYNYVQDVFRTAVTIDVHDLEYDEKIQVTVKAIMDWHNDGERGDESVLQCLPAVFFIPGHVGQEKAGTQPIANAIVLKMAQILSLGSHITKEQGIEKSEHYSRRFVDSVVTKPVEEHLNFIPASMLGVTIEVKPITRESTTFAKLLLEAQSQVVGHLAKRAMYSVDFGGIGEDCQVFGLVLNLASVTMVVLNLTGAGTAAVNVATQRSMHLPLFDKELRNKLFHNNEIDVETSLGDTSQEGGVSKGFCLLARTLMSARAQLGSSLWKPENRCRLSVSVQPTVDMPIKLGSPLGSGAFSHVFQVIQEDAKNDVFVKVPKSYELKNSLVIEARALKVLADNIYIPKLLDAKDPVKTLKITRGCESSKVPCLPLRGLIGDPARHQQGENLDWLENLVLKAYDALKYANSNGWAHLDVRPSNIITRGVDVMLIDWGCARRTNAKFDRFVGCLPYAHDDLFDQPKKRFPCLKHDLASLAYTVACLYRGNIPWSEGFSTHQHVAAKDMDNRYKITKAVLELLFRRSGDESHQRVREELLDAIRSRKRKREETA